MCDTVLAFGSNNSFHFECPTQWCKNDLPAEISAIFATGQVHSTYCIALGLGAESFVFCYLSKSNTQRLTSKNIPDQLRTWLYEKSASQQTDGANRIWLDLPTDLTSALRARVQNGGFIDAPRIVSLGFNGNFLLITENNTMVWNMGEYPEMDEQITKIGRLGTTAKITNIVLSPYAASTVMIVLTTGFSAYSGLPTSHVPQLQVLRAAIQKDTDSANLEREKRQIEIEEKRTEKEKKAKEKARRVRHDEKVSAATSGRSFRCFHCLGPYCHC